MHTAVLYTGRIGCTNEMNQKYIYSNTRKLLEGKVMKSDTIFCGRYAILQVQTVIRCLQLNQVFFSIRALLKLGTNRTIIDEYKKVNKSKPEAFFLKMLRLIIQALLHTYELNILPQTARRK